MIGQTSQKLLCVTTSVGKMHDFALFKSSRLALAPTLELLADTGYQGVDKLHSNSQTPHKKSKHHLPAHLGTRGKPGKVVVWAHNSHVGDARTTTMGQSGEWTLGQLMRQRQPEQTVLVGFTTYTGTVMAASMWGERGKVQKVLPALPGSFASLFHDTGVANFLLPLRGEGELVLAMGEPRLERAIGVVYLPQSERESHYFQARMSKQFDAVIHLDETTAVKPLPAG